MLTKSIKTNFVSIAAICTCLVLLANLVGLMREDVGGFSCIFSRALLLITMTLRSIVKLCRIVSAEEPAFSSWSLWLPFINLRAGLTWGSEGKDLSSSAQMEDHLPLVEVSLHSMKADELVSMTWGSWNVKSRDLREPSRLSITAEMSFRHCPKIILPRTKTRTQRCWL